MDGSVEIISWEPSRADSVKGRWLLDSNDFKFPEGFTAAQSAIVGFNPNGWAADHRHDRQEVLLGITGDLYLI